MKEAKIIEENEKIIKSWKDLAVEWQKLNNFAKRLQEFSVYLSMEQKRDLEGLTAELRRITRNVEKV